MGRRALSKVRIIERDEFSRVFRILEDIPKPLEFSDIFAQKLPAELEIGCGKGLFIRNAAAKSPQHNFLGIEIGKKYAAFSAAKIVQKKLGNAVILCGDAAKFLDEWVPPDTFESVHVYFPDPWWKRAHKKRRILREDVLKLIERSITPGGSLHFWTDVEEYYLSTLELIAEKTDLQGPFEVPETVAEHDMDYHTHFERRTRIHGDAVYRARFQKK